MRPMDLRAPEGAPFPFRALVEPGPPLRLQVSQNGGAARLYELAALDHGAFLDLHAALARDFDLCMPAAREAGVATGASETLRPVLTEPLAPGILYGYGDPCVVQVGPQDYRLLVTSNDAPDAFPILASTDLQAWRHTGFVFPAGSTPAWALTGPQVSDFWAPELHRVGDEWWVCFTAREADRTLAIGLARSASPDGPYIADETPLIGGGVIDAHVLVDAEGIPWLVWKRDDNAVWPRLIGALLHRRPELAARLFEGQALRTAALALTLWPWIAGIEPMQQFCALQTLIEAAAEDLERFDAGLERLAGELSGDESATITAARTALRTRILMQRLSPDGRGLEGEPVVILQNDQPWEGHLVEGVWITREADRYYLLYAGNDFSTSRYGIGAAVATSPTGPYVKTSDVFLRSTPEWWGPGHPSVARGPDGGWRAFLHGFRPGEVGYKAFRALLTAPLRLEDGSVKLAGP